MCRRSAAVLLVLLAGLGGIDLSPVAAQWWVDAAIGGASSEAVSAHVDTNSALLALRREGPVWVQLAGGLSLGSSGPNWVSLAGGGEVVRTGDLAFGGRAGGQSYLYSSDSPDSDGWGAIAEVGPFVRFGWGGADLEMRSSGIASTSVVDDEQYSRLLFSGAAEVAVQLPARLGLDGAAQYVLSKDAAYPFLGATLSQEVMLGGWWGRFGYWLTDEVESPEWSVGIYANAGRRIQVHALYRQETNDPIYERHPRRSWSLGLSVGLGGRQSPVSVSPVSVAGSTVTVRLSISEAPTMPSIAGDFNGWKTVVMTREGNFWTASFTIPSGVYRFSFRNEDGDWFLPESVENRVDDGFGGENGVLVVP